VRADDARPTSMSHYYHIGTSRVVTTPHGERTTTVIHAEESNEKKSVGGRETEREREGRAGAGEEERRGGEIILYFSYEPVRYVSSSVRQQCRVRALDGTGRKPSERIPPSSPRDREGSLGRFGHSIICGNAIPLSRFSGRRGWTMSLCSLVSCFRGMTAAETET